MTTVDRQIARAPLPHHSEQDDIAALLRRVTAQLEDGHRAEDLAALLAARGWATGTLGDGGSRSSDTTSSTERTVVAGKGQAGRWDQIDLRYAQALVELERAAERFENLHTTVMAHASDQDEVPSGTGECRACSMLCRPTESRPGFRLRQGLCPTCYRAWRRYTIAGHPLHRAEWVTRRRESFTERDAAGRVVQIHTPEPDHDIDLTVDLPDDDEPLVTDPATPWPGDP